MKTKELMKFIGNRTAYNKYRKRYLAYTGQINCSFCPYHRGENSGRDADRSWKKYRRYQWKQPRQ